MNCITFTRISTIKKMVINTKIQKTKKIITKNSEESEEGEKEEDQQQQASKKPDEIEPPKRTKMI